MQHLPLIPAPTRIEIADGAFRLVATTPVSGELADLLADELHTITGARPHVGGHGEIRLRISGEGRPESYHLTVTEHRVTLTGADRAGLRYGIWTLVQAVRRSGEGWEIPALDIHDAPRFAYRGFMIDVVRHFFDVATVETLIDRAARLKLNALHLHLSDDQGWRLEIASRPELTAKASGTAAFGDSGGHFTQADYARIVAHAASYDMIVVPEIDLPGHTHAVGVAYPDLVEEPVLTREMLDTVEAFGGDVPVKGEPCTSIPVGFSQLRIHHEPTYDFLADVLGEVAALTPGPLVHVGGDECLGTDPADFAYFMERVTTLVAGLGKTPVVWHEAGAAEGLARGTVGQFWGLRSNDEQVAAKARTFPERGGGVILSPADAIYLDMKYDEDEPLGLTWAGFVSLEQSYDWDPATLIDGIGEDAVLGVEAPTWTEKLTSLEELDHMMFPRIASAAEIGWSPAPEGHAWRTWTSFSGRLAGIAPLWEAQGIAFHRAPGVDWR